MINKLQFEIIRLLDENEEFSNEELASKLFKDNNLIESARKNLEENGYISGKEILPSGKKMLEEHKIDNAIILAAGMSTRFVPLSYEQPKGLLKVKGEVLVERQICQLREKGIQEVVIVVGYMKEKFQYLVDKYGVILVESKEYEKKNNHSSVYAAKRYLKNTIITSSDLYFSENIFQTYAYDAYYSSVYMSGKQLNEVSLQTRMIRF